MHDLGLDTETLQAVFVTARDAPYLLIEIAPDRAERLAGQLGTTVRRCYISDRTLAERTAATGRTAEALVQAKLPDLGSTMAGDFGEILTALWQTAHEHPTQLIDPWKWRLKADRTKPAGGSDVVQFALPEWPEASPEDRLICSEVKTKSTNRKKWSPVEEAIAHSQKDSNGRLPKTLVWLRERALDTGIESLTLEQLERFIDAIEHPPYSREFRAVAVICASLAEEELRDVAVPPASERALVILSVPDLKNTYESVYEAAVRAVSDEASHS